MRFTLVMASVCGLLGSGIGCGSGDADEPGGGASSSGQASSGSSGRSSSGAAASSSSGSSSGTSSSSGSTSSGGSSSGGQAARPWLVQCFYGAAIAGFDASNPDIEAACSGLTHTTVKTCAGASCQVGWAYTELDAAYAALFDALDSNDDDRVDANDEAYDIALLGHSWGATNVAEMGSRLLEDDRVAEVRKTVKLGMGWDPYRPGYTLRPSSNFERFVVLRQSIPPNDDCSRGVPLVGPFRGFSPRCAANQGCEDYDYSRSDEQAFPTYPSGSLQGDEVGHCTVFHVGFPVAKAILDGTALPPLPESVPVTP